MKKLIYLIPILLFSCTVNETCKDNSVGDYTWIQDSGNIALVSIKFRDDDSVVFAGTNIKHYSFDEGCGGITITSMVYSHWNINISGNTMQMQSDSIHAYFHH